MKFMKKTHLFSKAVAGICMIAICVTLPGYPVVSAKTAATVRLNKTKLEMTQGQKYKLKVTGIKKAKITFKSSAPSVASVNKSGNVTAKKKGSAKITVVIKKAKKKYKKICRVTVLAKKAAATPVPSATQTNAPAPAPTQSAASTPEPTKGVIFASSIKQALENNPLVTNSYTADPAVLEYNGRLYVYMTNDSQHYEKGEHKKSNTYGYIQSLHIISTDDMVNWTDHGTFQIAAANTKKQEYGVCKWAGCCWAPCAAYKNIDGKDQFFIYFTNGGYQIGVVQADSPAGPFHDPIGKALLGPQSDNETTTGALDPSVFTDDDGTSYLCYGNETGARIRKLADDMISFSEPEVEIDAPYFFEDSGINKIGDTYYFSYCSNWETRSEEYADLGLCSIGYMTSKNPEGPYTFRGDVLINCGNVFKLFGNNHHSITQFRGKYYMFYHTRVLEEKLGSELGFRSCHVNELTVNDDGTLAPVQQDLAGVSQIKDFDPYRTNLGITYSNCAGMLSTRYLTDGSYMQAVSDPENYDYSWSLVKGVQFGTDGASNFTAHFKMTAGTTAQIKVYTDALGQNEIASADIVPDESGNATISVPVSKLTDKHDLYFAFKGDVLSFEDWSFQK
jgi:arabinoxylan arabinofuranohydrolase